MEAESAAGGAATTGSGRVGNVDVLRAVAAFGVLTAHAYALGGRAAPIQAEYWYDVPLYALSTGVWLFFAISGYVIGRPFVDRLIEGRPLPELAPYALRRGFRIFPLYWVAVTTVIVVDGLAGTQPWQVPFHYALLQNLVPGQQEALLTVAWTLTIEVLFYVAVPLLALAVQRWVRNVTAERLAALVLASWGISIALTLIAGLAAGSSTGTWLRASFPTFWQMFCPGILVAIAPHLRDRRWRRWLVELPASRGALVLAGGLVAAAAVIAATATLSHGLIPYVTIVSLTRPLFALGYGLVLVAAIRARPWSETVGSWVLRLGLVSYGIYLFHAVIGDILLNTGADVLIPLPHGGFVAFIVHVAFLSALTIPVALASWRWFERPMLDVASRLSDRWRARLL
jgi:peptidoglycan/LPS O-acetylase OafA/YrhL